MSQQNWEIIHSEYLVKAPWAVLRKDRCKMPNGYIVPEYYVLEYPNWVNVVAVTVDQEVILVRQYRHGVKQSILEIPAGVIEEGESALEAAKRELLEETGYTFDTVEYLCELFPNPATSNNITTTYLATGGRKIQEQELDSQEDIEVQLMSLAELKKALLNNAFGQALHSAALFYALAHLKEL